MAKVSSATVYVLSKFFVARLRGGNSKCRGRLFKASLKLAGTVDVSISTLKSVVSSIFPEISKL